MSLRVLIAPDKFKGTVTASQAAEAIAAGWQEARPEDHLELLPISDGGDGFGELLGLQLRAEPQVVETVDAAHRPIQATWWWQQEQNLALVDTAQVIGLARLPPKRFHPFELDTFGLGAVLRAVARHHPWVCLVGIGGSATNDAGFGMARALGWRFLDQANQPIERWPELVGLHRVTHWSCHFRLGDLRVAVDVRNRLLGVRGATRVFGPQKGLRPAELPLAESALRRLARVMREQRTWPQPPQSVPGAGAAGGLGFAFHAFLRARLVSGFELFSTYTQVNERARTADLIITGEGALDETSVLMGKGVGQLAAVAARFKVPCLALAGVIPRPQAVRRYFVKARALAPTIATVEQAQADAAACLRRLARETAQSWPPAPAH